MGREHEDLVLVTGRLGSGVAFNCVVDWLSPTKVRRTRVLGERGMLVADTLTADLTFYENGDVDVASGTRRAGAAGVSEGDMTRYALARREPLLVELEAFCRAASRGDDGAAVVTLEEGLETVARRRGGPRQRRARRDGPLSAVVKARRRRARQDRAAARGAASRWPGHEVVGCDIDERVVDARQRRRAAVPRRGRARRGARARSSATAACARTTDTAAAVADGPGPRHRRAAAARRRRARSPTGAILDAVARRHRRAACRPGTTVAIETTVPVGTTRARIAPALEARQRPDAPSEDFHVVFSPERVFCGRVFARPRRPTRSSSAA